jgi:hypothetical protein
MKLTQSRSATTWTMSPESSAPRPPAPPQLEAVAEVEPLARPVLDPRVGPHDVLAIGLVQEHARVEPLRPLDHRRVVVGMRDRDRVHAPCRAHRLLRVGVDQRDAVPQEAVHEERPLADPEARLGADAEQARLDLLDPVCVIRRQLGYGRPALAVVADVLALVEADGAARRRLRGRRELGAAGDADVGVHPC